MAMINFSVQHGQTLDQARSHLQATVVAVTTRFGPLIRGQQWSADRNQVKLSGPGFVVDLSVDPRDVHLSGDITGLGGILSSPLVSGLKQIVQQNFTKRLK